MGAPVHQLSGFDTLSWITPPQSSGLVLPAGADMLPLIVGALEDKSTMQGAASPSEVIGPRH